LQVNSPVRNGGWVRKDPFTSAGDLMSATETAPAADDPVPVIHDWSLGYTMVRASLPLVRLHAKRRLELWCWPGAHEDAILVVSELVANAVNHARVVGHEVRLRLAVTEDGALSIEVSDPVPDFPGFDHTPALDEMDEGGRGLGVVRALAAELAWSPRRHVGKTVRARVAGRFESSGHQ